MAFPFCVTALMRGSWPAISACSAWCFFSRFWTPIKSLPERETTPESREKSTPSLSAFPTVSLKNPVQLKLCQVPKYRFYLEKQWGATENFGGEQFHTAGSRTAFPAVMVSCWNRRERARDRKSKHLPGVSATPQTLEQASHFIPIWVSFFLFFFSVITMKLILI